MSMLMNLLRPFRSLVSWFASLGLAILLARPGFAQSPPEAIEPNVGDTGPLSLSLRKLSVDLKRPSNFERLFQVPGDGDSYMRSNGALHAVFPRSVYGRFRTRRGRTTRAVVPDGTVFYIGDPPTHERPERPPAEVEQRNSPIGHKVSEGPISLAVPVPAEGYVKLHPTRRRVMPSLPSTICTDETYRTSRLHALMRQAARSGKSGG